VGAFVDPWGDVFAYVGRLTTGTFSGDYLISGPGWRGVVPEGVTQIVSPNNTVLLIGRVLVESDSDLATAHGLEKQIRLTPLSLWLPGQYHSNALLPRTSINDSKWSLSTVIPDGKSCSETGHRQ
jgi:hypothetical protein